MNTIFDEEDQVVYRQHRQVMPMLAPRETGQGYLIPSNAPRLTYVTPAGQRKRTMMEALERLPKPIHLGPNVPGGIQRVARKPLMIYNAAVFLSAGFVIVDPLNRLDGGLID